MSIHLRRNEDGDEEVVEDGFPNLVLGVVKNKCDGEKILELNGKRITISPPNVHGQREVSDGEEKYNFEKRVNVSYTLFWD